MTDDSEHDGSAPTAAAAPTVTSLSPADAELWLRHVTACFQAKGTPRSYFERHLLSDPHVDYAGIIVLHADDANRCVSSVRVFVRAVFIAGERAMLGGIGEVSTQPAWRGRGYAELCLKRSCEYLASLGIALSSLHTSNAADYYAKLGWTAVNRTHSLLDIAQVAQREETTARLAFSLLQPQQLVPSPLLVSLASLHSSYAAQFDGPVSRSAEYWSRWVRAEHEAAAATPSPVIAVLAHDASTAAADRPLIGYLFLQRLTRPLSARSEDGAEVSIAQHDLVREFACADVALEDDGGRAVFLALLARARQETAESVQLTRVASPIALQFRPALPAAYAQPDSGFMYRPIASSPLIAASAGTVASSSSADRRTVQRDGWGEVSARSGSELLQRLQQTASSRHVFFATDAF